MNDPAVYTSHIDSSDFDLQCYLDVQAGKPISLAGNDIVEKIIGRHRGGYCYEVNGLFALALQKIGIPYILIAAHPPAFQR